MNVVEVRGLCSPTPLGPEETYTDQDGMLAYGGHELVLSRMHGGVTLTAVTLVIVGLGVLLFKRRDLN